MQATPVPIGLDNRDDVIPLWGLPLLFHSPIGLHNKTSVRPTYGSTPKTYDKVLIGHQAIDLAYNTILLTSISKMNSWPTVFNMPRASFNLGLKVALRKDKTKTPKELIEATL